MKRKAFTLIFAAMAGIAHAQTAFPSGVTSYVYVGAAGPNASTEPLMMYTSSNVAGANFINGTAITGVTGKLNGFGLNKTDNFLYGIGFQQAATTAAPFYRVGSDGVAQQVGIIQPPLVPGATIALINTTAGMNGANDNYYVTAYTYSGNPFLTPYTVSNFKFFIGIVPAVSTLTAGVTPLTPVYHEVNISDPALQSAFQSFLDNFDYLNPGYSDGGVEDIAIHPSTGQIYSYMSYPDGNGSLVGRPVVVNPATWVAATVGSTINTSPGLEIAGAYFSTSANFYVLFTNGTYTQVNLTTGAIGTLMPTNLPLQAGTLRGDLASDPTISVLPVTILSFTGRAAAAGNELQWKSGSEQDVQYYMLERSKDGSSFETLAAITATGSGSNYTFTDTKPFASSYYRFKTVDRSGKWQYSQVITLSAVQDNATVTIYPTVVTDNRLYISADAKRIHVIVYDINGKQVSNTMAASATGNYELNIPALNHGIYFIRVADLDNGETLAVQKITAG